MINLDRCKVIVLCLLFLAKLEHNMMTCFLRSTLLAESLRSFLLI